MLPGWVLKGGRNSRGKTVDSGLLFITFGESGKK